MKVVIIGSGNTATVLGRRMRAVGHELLQVIARRPEPAALLAKEWGCTYATRWEEIDRTADLYIVAISDRGLDDLGESLSLPGKLVVHTAGAVPVSVLKPVSMNCGVLYPLQSLKATIRSFQEIPLLIDANQREDLPRIEAFARSLSGLVRQADDTTRLKLHLSAILVNNFTNYLFVLAEEFCRGEQIDFSLLLPLIQETGDRITRFPPGEMQTGPAVRGDRVTIQKHLDILSKYENIKELYELFTIQIESFYRPNENPVS